MSLFFFFFKINCLFLLWLHWVFVAACGFLLAAKSRGYSLVVVCRLLISVAFLLWSMGSRHVGSVVVALGLCSCGSWGPRMCRLWQLCRVGSVVVYELSCPAACRIFLDQGSNLCPLHWQADFYPLYHLGSLSLFLFQQIYKSNNAHYQHIQAT